MWLPEMELRASRTVRNAFPSFTSYSLWYFLYQLKWTKTGFSQGTMSSLSTTEALHHRSTWRPPKINKWSFSPFIRERGCHNHLHQTRLFLEESVSTDNASEEAHWIRRADDSKGRILPQPQTGASCQHSPAAPAVMTAHSCKEPTLTSSFICIGSYFYDSNGPSSSVRLSRDCYTIFPYSLQLGRVLEEVGRRWLTNCDLFCPQAEQELFTSFQVFYKFITY